jgi:type I restriction enzyme S subunit
VSINSGVTLRTFSDDRIESVAEDFSTYKVARTGRLVFNKMRFWQGAAGIAPVDGLTSPDYVVAEVGDALNPKFVELLVRLPQFSDEVRRYSHGMVDDHLRLYWDEFKTIRIPVPPLDDQHAIVSFLAHEGGRTAEFQRSLNRSIALLKERRSALITAAVTGQLSTLVAP